MCSRTRLTILTGSKNNHKVKIAETGQFAVGIRPLDIPLDCKYTFCIISENTDCIDYQEGGGGGGGVCEKEGTGVKWASHYSYIYIYSGWC